MVVFTDSSFADCEDMVSTCGYVIRMFNDTIAWRTQKQRYVALSTCEAEYIAMSLACQETVALNNSLLRVTDKSFFPVKLFCDNKAAIISANTPGGNKLRHQADVCAHYVKECVKYERVDLEWVKSEDQLADIMTKPLAFKLYRKLRDEILNH